MAPYIFRFLIFKITVENNILITDTRNHTSLKKVINSRVTRKYLVLAKVNN